MSDKLPLPTDLRKQQRQAEQHLAWWVAFFLVVVGGATIWLVYGLGAALLGMVCLIGGALLFGLLWLIVSWIERWAGQE